jgi:hypothetical protein
MTARTHSRNWTKLDEVQTGGYLGRGFLRKPAKLIKLNMKMKDIMLSKQ